MRPPRRICHAVKPCAAAWQNSTHAATGVECVGYRYECPIRQQISIIDEGISWLLHYHGAEGPLEEIHEGAAPVENCRSRHEKRGVGEDAAAGHVR